MIPYPVAFVQAPPPLSIEEAVRRTLSHNPRVAAARKDAEAARIGARSARALANPEIQVAPALGSLNGTSEELLITQPLEINGARTARARQAAAQARADSARAAIEIREVISQVKDAYVELWRERELLGVARDVLESATTVSRLTDKQVELGSRPGIDRAQAGLEVLHARQALTQAQGRVRSAEARIATLMGAAAAPVAALAPPEEVSAFESLDAATTRALTARTEIEAEAAALETVRQEEALVRAEGRPDLAPQFRAQQLVTRRARPQDYGFSVAIRLPLVDWGARRERRRQSEAAASAQMERIEAARQQVTQEVALAHARLQAAQTVLLSFADALPLAQRLLAASRIGFEEGKTTLLAILEAQRAYRTTLSEHTQARAEVVLARIELDRATGGPSGGTLR